MKVTTMLLLAAGTLVSALCCAVRAQPVAAGPPGPMAEAAARRVMVLAGYSSRALHFDSIENGGVPLTEDAESDLSREVGSARWDQNGNYFEFSTSDKEVVIGINVKSLKLNRFIDASDSAAFTTLSERQCVDAALAWLRKMPLEGNREYELLGAEDETGAYELEFGARLNLDGRHIIGPPTLSVRVDGGSGNVLSFDSTDFPQTHPAPQPLWSSAQAVAVARKLIASNRVPDGNGSFRGGGPGILSSVWLMLRDAPADKTHPYSNCFEWRVAFKGGWMPGVLDDVRAAGPSSNPKPIPPPPGFGLIDWVLNVYDGQSSVAYAEANIGPHAEEVCVEDRDAPRWVDDHTIDFVGSFNGFEGHQEPGGGPADCLARAEVDSPGKPSRLVFKMPRGLSRSFESLSGVSALGYVWSDAGHLRLINPPTGTLMTIGEDDSPEREAPAWNSASTFLAATGTLGSDRPDSDLVIDLYKAVRRPSGPPKIIQIMTVGGPGGSSMPLWFRKADAFLYLHATPQGQLTLMKAVVSVRKAVGEMYSVATSVVVKDPPVPERFSWFPDGHRVLLGMDDDNNPKAIVVADIVTGKVYRMPFHTVRDPQYPKYPLTVSEAVVSPNGKRLAFVSRCWSRLYKDPESVNIYTCDLDGSHVVRVTPMKEVHPQVVAYPQAGVNGINAWDKLQPPPETALAPDENDPKLVGSHAYIEKQFQDQKKAALEKNGIAAILRDQTIHNAQLEAQVNAWAKAHPDEVARQVATSKANHAAEAAAEAAQNAKIEADLKVTMAQQQAEAKAQVKAEWAAKKAAATTATAPTPAPAAPPVVIPVPPHAAGAAVAPNGDPWRL